MNTIEQEMQRLNKIANLYNKTEGEMKEMWKQKWHELVKMWQGGWMSLRLRDLQQVLSKFSDGNKGTAISDCFVYMENDQGGLNEIGRIELQESRLIGKINSSAAWRVVLKKDRKTTRLQSTTFKI